MSGTIGSNILSHSGIIAETAAGLNWVSDVVTASTVTVEAGNGYWIDTTSNACTITLPASAEAGDNIVIVDFARTWGTNNVTLDSNGLNFQGNSDVYENTYSTNGQSINLIYSDATKGWIPLEDDVVANEPVAPPTQRGLFGYGHEGTSGNSFYSITNLINSSGTVASDTSGVGTGRWKLAAASYGGDKAIFAFGQSSSATTNVSNLVGNNGVVASDTTGVGTARNFSAAAGYGGDKAIFAFGGGGGPTNLVSNQGVVATDVTRVGANRYGLGGASYGVGLAIFGYGSGPISTTNLVNTSGVVGSDVTGVGTARQELAACSYGGDKAIFGYGFETGGASLRSMTNKVSNTGVVASDTTGVGTVRNALAACGYGGDKGIFGFGQNASSTALSMTNKVSNSGTVADDTSGVGTARWGLAAAGYSFSS